MGFSVHGVMRGQHLSVTWNDGGVLGGDWAAVKLLQLADEARTGEQVGPPGGPFTVREHLKEPVSAWLLMQGLFDQIIRLEGDLPPQAYPPEGAQTGG